MLIILTTAGRQTAWRLVRRRCLATQTPASSPPRLARRLAPTQPHELSALTDSITGGDTANLLVPRRQPGTNAARGHKCFLAQTYNSAQRKKHLSKGDRNEENQTQPVVNKRFFSCLPLQPNSRERQDNARFPLPSHYLFRYLPEA